MILIDPRSIHYGKCIEWSAFLSEIKRVVTKSHELSSIATSVQDLKTRLFNVYSRYGGNKEPVYAQNLDQTKSKISLNSS